MNAGPTSERVYAALKSRLLGNEFPPGARLDPAVLANDLVSSVTPVRDALHRLTGERLVDTRMSDGFHMPHVTGPGLEDLYAWHAEVLLAARRRRPFRQESAGSRCGGQNIVERTANLFASIAARSANGEHHDAIASIGDRLSAARWAEIQVMEDPSEELDRIALARGDSPSLRKAIIAYHRKRRSRVPEIVRALYRAG